MVETLLVVSGLVSGISLGRLALLMAAVMAPIPMAALLVFHLWRGRDRNPAGSVLFCEAAAGELRSGASVRQAIARAARSVEELELARLAEGGAPLSDIGRTATQVFGDIGAEVAVVITRSAVLGAPTADLFDEISILALSQVEVEDEVHSATAPARATAIVLLAVPVAAISWAVSTGRAADYLTTQPQRISAMAGLVLAMAGVVVGGLMMRRTR